MAKAKAKQTRIKPTIKATQAIDRQFDALELRKAGHTFQSIADQLGYATADSAYKSVQAAMQKTLREAGSEEVRAMELERLDRMQLAIWPAALGVDKDGLPLMDADKPVPPHGDSIDRVLKIMKRRAELLGLDAPAKREVTGADGAPLLDMTVLSERDFHDLGRLINKIAPGEPDRALAGLSG